MSNERSQSGETQRPQPVTEERGLQPATNPPQMPQVRPPKSEKGSG
jgi:hypothetical protein